MVRSGEGAAEAVAGANEVRRRTAWMRAASSRGLKGLER